MTLRDRHNRKALNRRDVAGWSRPSAIRVYAESHGIAGGAMGEILDLFKTVEREPGEWQRALVDAAFYVLRPNTDDVQKLLTSLLDDPGDKTLDAIYRLGGFEAIVLNADARAKRLNLFQQDPPPLEKR